MDAKRVPHQHYQAPNRCWYQTRQDVDGRWLWASREWRPGEVPDILRSKAFTKPEPRP